MSLLPFIQHPFSRREWWDVDFPTPSQIFDQHFGLTLTDEDLFPPQFFSDFYIRPRRGVCRANSGMWEVTNDANAFKVNLETKHFKPEELSVKVVEDIIVVTGNHEKRNDGHGYVSRHFVRHYGLPPGSNPDDVTAELANDGRLQITAPKQPPQPHVNEHIIPITTVEKTPEAKL